MAEAERREWPAREREDVVERYERAMRRAEETYEDVLAALRAAEVPAFMTQTGGMCLAIEFKALDGDGWWWLCDKEDSLSWERDESQGWGLGRYAEEGDGTEAWIVTCDRKTVDEAVRLVTENLHRGAARG